MSHMTNPLATPDQLRRRNAISSLHNLPADLLDIIYFSTQSLTQAAGLLLRLPQSVTAQANVILARYWLQDSPFLYEFSDTSAATLYLTSKLSSHPTPARDICNVYAYLTSTSSPFFRPSSSSSSSTLPPPPLSEPSYNKLHNQILQIESRIFSSLGFDTHVSLPHPLAITYLQALDLLLPPPSNSSSSQQQQQQQQQPNNKNDNAGAGAGNITSRTISHLNAALLSPQLLYLTHQPHSLAVAAVYLAARETSKKISPECPWWEVFDVDREELGFLVLAMRSLEGWAVRMREEYNNNNNNNGSSSGSEEENGGGLFENGVVTREAIRKEMKKEKWSGGLELVMNFDGGGGGGGGGGIDKMEETPAAMDEEEEMMRRMDSRAAGAGAAE